MTKTNVAIALMFITALVAIGATQTSAQSQQGQVGRYQLLSAKYTALTLDAENKVEPPVEQNALFKIDTVTGETYLLGHVVVNGSVNETWVSVTTLHAGRR